MSDEAFALPDLTVEEILSDDFDAMTLFLEARWPDGYVCPKCGGRDNFCVYFTRSIFKCQACGFQHTVLSGTMLDNHRLGYNAIAAFIFARITERNLSAVARRVGIDYTTAHRMDKKMRRARRATGPFTAQQALHWTLVRMLEMKDKPANLYTRGADSGSVSGLAAPLIFV